MEAGVSIIISLPELFFGKAIKSLIVSEPAKRETHLSKPKATPPCGGAPYLNALRRNPNCFSAYFNTIDYKIVGVGSD